MGKNIHRPKKHRRSNMKTVRWAAWGAFGDEPSPEVLTQVNEELRKHRVSIHEYSMPSHKWLVYKKYYFREDVSLFFPTFSDACKYCVNTYDRVSPYRERYLGETPL